MAEAYKLYTICKTCKGVGTIDLPLGAGPTPTSVECPECDGAKIILASYCTVATYEIPDIP